MPVIILVAAALRCFALGSNSLWIDELATLQVARHTLAEIPAAALQDDAFEPPLYFWLTHLVAGVAGESETALRVLSALAGIALVPLLWALLRALGASQRASVLVAALAAVHPLLLWYSQEARPYALLLALGTGSLLFLALALERGGWRNWAGYTVLGGLAMLTHVVGVVFPAAGFLWVTAERRGRALVAFVVASAGMLVVIAPFLLALAQSVAQAEGTGSPPRPLTGLEVPYTLFTFVAGYSFGPAVREIQDIGWRASVWAHPVQAVLSAITLGVALLIAALVRGRAAIRLATLFALPVLATVLGSAVTGKAYSVRYALPAVLGLLGLVALGLASLGSRPRALATGLLAGVFVWADLQWFTLSRYRKEDSRSAVACLARVLPPGALVAVAPAYMSSVLRHYAARSGADITPVGLQSPRDRLEPAPSALLLTRLHHVPAPDLIVDAFADAAGPPIATAAVPGYRVYFAGPRAAASAAACGGSS